VNRHFLDLFFLHQRFKSCYPRMVEGFFTGETLFWIHLETLLEEVEQVALRRTQRRKNLRVEV